MKFLKQGICLALLGAGLASVPISQAIVSSANAATPPSTVEKMRERADGTLSVSREPATGKVSFVRASGANADLLPGVAGAGADSAAAKATSYLDTYGSAFGAAKGTLTKTKVTADAIGWTVSYEQRYQGVPVFGSGVKARVDKAGDLTSINGFAVPDLALSTTPKVSKTDAAARAVRTVTSEPPAADGTDTAADTTGVKATKKQLVVYRKGFLKGDVGESVLAWTVEVTNKVNIRDMVILDAATGKVVNRYSMGNDALDRELREAAGTAQNPTFTTVYEEGDDITALNEDQQNLVNTSGESYYMYANAFGRDSYDGLGAKRITVNNDPRINCPNANWNGVTTNYCDGVTSDDVVGHEWGHAYTEYTSGLIYQFQPGALNESYSDVWGETLDQINGREDEDEVFDTKRVDNACSPFEAPLLALTVAITAPPAAAGGCQSAFGFGPKYTTTAESHDVVATVDPADAAGPLTTDGCSPFTNAAAVAGNYAYVDRGTCSFQIKADNAVAAGATGLIVGQNTPAAPSLMSGMSTIPATMIAQADGARVKTAGTVTMSFQLAPSGGVAGSSRWLIGEKSTAFGGAIRDMWTPTCFGDPGKVSDAEYNCDPDNLDAGGVHGNSGVPNHLYALAVDGGTYNGQTLSGIGLDQAANIWWRAQTAYLVPASKFADAADAFESSCAELTGQPINKLDVTPGASPVPATPITAANCADLGTAIDATEMRAPVTQCNFQPLLAAGDPAACGDGFVTKSVFTEDFEDGLAGWAAEPTVLGDGGADLGFPWEASTTAPGNHAGGVAFGPTPDEGDCSGDGVNDFSSSDAITSGSIAIPGAGYASTHLEFDHYVATEAGFDGGNLQISRNGGTFTPVAASAYDFNAPKTLASAPDNTSPIAGQPGFTGTDGGEVTGSWGTSLVDLAKAGVQPGDTVKLRFVVGRDGCGGIDGWYIDNVVVTVCNVTGEGVATVAATHVPEPVEAGKPSSVVATVTGAAGEATGTVTVAEGATVLGSADLAAGTATVPLPTTLSVGTHSLTVSYAGSTTYAPASTTVTATVTAAPVVVPPPTTPPAQVVSATKAKAPGSVRRGAKFKAKIKIISAASTTGGSVKIKAGGKVVGKATVVNGKVKVKIKTSSLKRGKVKFKVVYSGTATTLPSKTSFKVNLK